jgi:cytoskeleton protein RodZ
MSESYIRNAGSAGAMLAAAREELNLSVYDVARYLKISPAQVEALEEGAYERLPGRVFVRGFLRNYAKFLGIDAQPLLRSIEAEMPQPKAKDEPPPSPEVVMPHGKRSNWPLYLGFIGLFIVGALAVYEFGFNDTARSRAHEEPVTQAAPVTPAAPAATPPDGTLAPAAAPPAVPPATANTDAFGASSAAPRMESGATAQADVPPALPMKPGERELAFKFDEESWVEVRNRDGKVIFSKLNRPGTEERVRGMPPFKLVIGNARSVHLSYDQQPVELTTHTGVTVARLTLE